jgi:hypothetical protein
LIRVLVLITYLPISLQLNIANVEDSGQKLEDQDLLLGVNADLRQGFPRFLKRCRIVNPFNLRVYSRTSQFQIFFLGPLLTTPQQKAGESRRIWP